MFRRVLDLTDTKVPGKTFLLSSAQKSKNSKINKKITKMKNSILFEGQTYLEMMQLTWKNRYRIVLNDEVQDEDDLFDKYHLYRVKKEFWEKYKDQKVDVDLNEMDGRIYSLDQSFYVLMREFLLMNTKTPENEIDWVKKANFQSHISSSYPNLTKELAKYFYDSLKESMEAIESLDGSMEEDELLNDNNHNETSLLPGSDEMGLTVNDPKKSEHDPKISGHDPKTSEHDPKHPTLKTKLILLTSTCLVELLFLLFWKRRKKKNS